MSWFWWIVLAVAIVVALFLLFTSKAQRSRQEVIDYIEHHINGTGGPWDWDDFTSVRIADPILDTARTECLRIELEVDPQEKAAAWRDVCNRLRAPD